MRSIRLLAASCAALLLAACSSDLLPTPGEVTGAWTSRETFNAGPNGHTVYNNLSLGPDGRYIWSQTTYGDGAGHPDLPVYRSASFGQYRVRDRFLEIRAEVMEYIAPPSAGRPDREVVEKPRWSGDQYRLEVDGDILTLRFTVAPADLPEDVTLIFQRDRPID